MKIQGAKKVHYDSGPNMTPLVDVVMVILIFLMLAGSFGATERYLISDVPVSAKGAGGKPKDGQPIPKKFTIQVQQDGPFYIAKAGNFAAVRSINASAAYDQLLSNLKSQLNSFKDAGVNVDDVQVIVYPQPAVSMENLTVVYQAVLEAGFKKVGFGIP